MSRYCENRSAATVDIVWSSGEKKRVTSGNPYIDITSLSQAPYTLHYYYQPIGTTGEGNFFRDIGSFPAPLILGSIVYSNPSESGFGGYTWSDVNYTDGDGNSGTIPVSHNAIYGHTVSNVRVTTTGIVTKVSIADKDGTVIEVSGNGTATWQVSCDSDCPEGSHKCTHNKYPGYCCVPCKEVGDRLKNIASKVRG